LNYLMNLPPVDPDAWWDVQSFRSKHPGGVHFCAVDGSVRFVADGVDHTAFRVSCTRNGEEISTESL